MRSLYYIFSTFLLTLPFPAVLSLPASEADISPPYRAPLHRPEGNHSIEDTYIVKFFDNHTLEQHYSFIRLNLSESHNLLQRYKYLPGYHARLEQDLLDLVRSDPGVNFVEQDYAKETSDHDQVAGEVEGPGEPQGGKFRRWIMDQIPSAWWWRATMSEAGRFRGNKGAKRTATFIKGVGRGVYIYIFDSGIRLTHQEFLWPENEGQPPEGEPKSRASNFEDKTTSAFCNGESMEDTDGHGTAMASAAGGRNYGMAFYAYLVSVKVSCTNKNYRTASNLIAAVEAVTAEHVSRKGGKGFKGSVINMSFNDDRQSKSEAEAFAKARILGIVLVASAGNNKKEKVSFPCAYAGVLCIGASTRDYSIWNDEDDPEGSNWGSHLWGFAPGKSVMVATYKSDKGGYLRSGTSISAPLVGGTLAGFISYESLASDAQKAEDRLNANSLPGILDNIPDGTPNVLANNGLLRTPQIGIPDQLPYIDAPPIEGLEEAAMVKLASNSSQTQDGGLSSIFTDSPQSTNAVDSTAVVLPDVTMHDDCATDVVVLQWSDYTMTTTIQPQITLG